MRETTTQKTLRALEAMAKERDKEGRLEDAIVLRFAKQMVRLAAERDAWKKMAARHGREIVKLKKLISHLNPPAFRPNNRSA